MVPDHYPVQGRWTSYRRDVSTQPVPRPTRSTFELAERFRGAVLLPARPAQRAAAAGIDLLYATVLGCVPVLTAVLLLGLDGTLSRRNPVLLAACLLALVVVLGCGTVWPFRAGGRSPGKQMVRLRAAMTDGSRPRISAHAVRFLLLPADVLLGPLLVLLRADGRRLGDLVAGTVVVSDVPLAQPSRTSSHVPAAIPAPVAVPASANPPLSTSQS